MGVVFFVQKGLKRSYVYQKWEWDRWQDLSPILKDVHGGFKRNGSDSWGQKSSESPGKESEDDEPDPDDVENADDDADDDGKDRHDSEDESGPRDNEGQLISSSETWKPFETKKFYKLRVLEISEKESLDPFLLFSPLTQGEDLGNWGWGLILTIFFFNRLKAFVFY